MLPWFWRPRRAQVALGQGGSEVRRLFADATGDFDICRIASKPC